MLKRQTLSLYLLFSTLSGHTVARELTAEDLLNMPLEDLVQVEVVSASRLGQTSHESPASLSVLTARDIRTFGWRTLAEALNSLRGVFTSNDRNYSYIGVRGFMHPNDYNSRVLLMIDGQRMNENIYDSSYIAQEFMLDMDMVERIEYVPGSGASIYGANAYTGLINVITKKEHALNGVQVAGEVATFNTYKARVSYGKQLANGADVLFSASHYDSSGVGDLYFAEFDKPETNYGVAHNMDAERADRLFARFQHQDFTLMGGYVDRFKRVPTASFGTVFNDPTFYTRDRQFFGNLKYEKALADHTTLRMKGAFQGYDYISDLPYGETVGINTDLASGRWWSGEAQLVNTDFAGHRLMLGVEYQYDQRQHLYSMIQAPYLINNDSNLTGNRVEAYVQDDIKLFDTLILSAGLRLDYHHMLQALQLNPRIGMIWNPLESTTFKWLYSSTFRAPNAWEYSYNVNVRAERIKSYESIAEWRGANGLKLTADLFFNDMTGLLERDGDPDSASYGEVVNLDHYHTLGVELESEKRWDSGRLFKTSYTYSRVTNEHDGGVWAEASPQQLFKLHYAEPLFDNAASLGVENIYIGERRTLQGGLADAYNLVNINLQTDKLLPGVVMSFGAYNLLNTHYQLLGGDGTANSQQQNILPMNGRELRLKVQLTY